MSINELRDVAVYSFYRGLPNLQSAAEGQAPTSASPESVSQIDPHKACDEAYTRGYDAGYNDAVSATKAKSAEFEKIALQIDHQIREHTNNANAAYDRFAAGIAKVLHDVIASAFPALRTQFGVSAAIEFLRDIAPKIQSNVTVEVHSDMVDELKVWLCQDATLSYAANDHNLKQMNILEVVEREGLEYGDVRVEFGDCGVERLLCEYESALGAIVQTAVCKTIKPPKPR